MKHWLLYIVYYYYTLNYNNILNWTFIFLPPHLLPLIFFILDPFLFF